MSFCPFNQDVECSSKCAIWDNRSLNCSFYGVSMLFAGMLDRLSKINEELVNIADKGDR